MNGALSINGSATCVCNETFGQRIVIEGEEVATLADLDAMLRMNREKVLTNVARAVLAHSATHSKVSMVLTLDMEEILDV